MCCVCSILLQVEGVDSHGRMYLLRRPDHAEIEARLWRLHFEADNNRIILKWGHFLPGSQKFN